MTKTKFKFCIVAGVLLVVSAYPVSYLILHQEWVWTRLPSRIQSWVGSKSGGGITTVPYETVYRPLISTEQWVEKNQLRREVIGKWSGEYRRRTIEVEVTDVDFEKCSFEVYENGQHVVSLEFEAFYKNLRDSHTFNYPMKTFEKFQDTAGNSFTVNWGDEPSAHLVFKSGIRSDASMEGWARDSNYVYLAGVYLKPAEEAEQAVPPKSDRAGG